MTSIFRRLGITGAALVVMASGGMAAAVPAPDSDRPDQPAYQLKENRTVTLVTGDRVVLAGGDPHRAAIDPGPGREKVRFRTYRTTGGLFVFPSDVLAPVAAGTLDRRLFDVTGLIRDGYDDRAAKTIPLIVTGGAMRFAGATVTRDLPAIDGAAVRLAKGVNALQSLGARSGVEKVWLDGKRRTVLDQSVPQIGTPAAWQAGYTGKGTTVAVLDGGVEAEHPDLVGQVAEAKNFSESPAGDADGHGTHVASTIAGTAAASSGKYRGVAPDTKILDGKVCEDGGWCFESAILAGMQWAATEKRADVINLSLGGMDTPAVDPLEEAVNTLTQQTGSLFVIAAGNDGPGAKTVASPGSADAALTVGAVDKQDQLAFFSSRGPRVGDGAVKPDVTAPGVDIVAAKARRAWIGTPVGEHYLRLSGTSMATPHTAGAAALLAQQHPDWSAAQLKAALMASANALPEQGVFEQGAGRVDLAKAITQTVVADPGSVSFGTAVWPHHDDVPVTKQLTYRNTGAADVTLNLRGALSDPDGSPAPAAALGLGASSVTVPAGGTASVTVSSNTNHAGPDGGYSGRITATGPGGVVLSTPIGVDKEVESYTLTVNHVQPDGSPNELGNSLLIGLDDFRLEFLADKSGTASIRLPKGRYFLDGTVLIERGPDDFDYHQLVQPLIQLDQDRTIGVDARLTKPVSTTVPRADAKPVLIDLGLSLQVGNAGISGSVLADSFDGLFTAPLGDPLPAEQFNAHIASTWGVPGTDGRFTNTPYSYHLVNGQPSRYWHGFSRAVNDGELATVRHRQNAQIEERQAMAFSFGFLPGMGGAWARGLRFDLPSRTTQYLEAGAATWSRDYEEFVLDEQGFPVTMTVLRSPSRSYRAGQADAERWNAAVFGPRLTGSCCAVRFGDDMFAGIPMYSDQDGHFGGSRTDTAATKLYRDGVLVGETKDVGFVEAEDLAAADGEFRLVTTATRPKVSNFSTRTDAEWTFRSATASEEGELLPLWAVRYHPNVDPVNSVRRSTVSVLPVTVETQDSPRAGKLRRVEVQVSGDEGASWRTATVQRIGDGRYLAIFGTPRGAAVSLRAKVADSNGNTSQQTIIRAYGLR